jgi:ubiquitin-conjugating enzyme E2 Z
MSYIRRIFQELEVWKTSRSTKDYDDIYALDYDDDDLTTIHAVIKAPVDSLYKYKFIRLEMKFQSDYPFQPPTVKFIQYGGKRIHPNLYVEGKVCLSILNTWSGPKWNPIMNIDTILRTVQSLLDNQPYVHEPGQKDNAEYNTFVEYHSWKTMFIDLQTNEKRSALRKYMQSSTIENMSEIKRYLLEKERMNAMGYHLVIPYGINSQRIDWSHMATEITNSLKSYHI